MAVFVLEVLVLSDKVALTLLERTEEAVCASGEGVKEGDVVNATVAVDGGLPVRDPVRVPVWRGEGVTATTLEVAVRLGVVEAVKCIEGVGKMLIVRLPPFPGLAVGSPEVDGEREGDLVTLPLPLCVPASTLPVGKTLGVRTELKLMFELALPLRDTVTEGDGLREVERLLESVDALLALGLLLLVPWRTPVAVCCKL